MPLSSFCEVSQHFNTNMLYKQSNIFLFPAEFIYLCIEIKHGYLSSCDIYFVVGCSPFHSLFLLQICSIGISHQSTLPSLATWPQNYRWCVVRQEIGLIYRSPSYCFAIPRDYISNAFQLMHSVRANPDKVHVPIVRSNLNNALFLFWLLFLACQYLEYFKLQKSTA